MVNHTLQELAWGRDSDDVADFEKERYVILKQLAVGREGTVFAAVDLTTMELVAIKKVGADYRISDCASYWTHGMHHSCCCIWCLCDFYITKNDQGLCD